MEFHIDAVVGSMASLASNSEPYAEMVAEFEEREARQASAARWHRQQHRQQPRVTAAWSLLAVACGVRMYRAKAPSVLTAFTVIPSAHLAWQSLNATERHRVAAIDHDAARQKASLVVGSPTAPKDRVPLMMAAIDAQPVCYPCDD